jgi:beta-lactamase class A
MHTVNAWLRPSYYYVHGERVHRQWARVLLVCSIIALFSSFGVRVLIQHRQGNSVLNVPTPPASTEPLTAPAPSSDALAPSADKDSTYQGLQKEVDYWVSQQTQGHWSVMIQDLNNPYNQVLSNENEVYYTGSMYKLFLTIALAQKIPFTQWQTQTLDTSDGNRTYAECVHAIIATTDNACADALGDKLDWSKAARTIKAQGFKDTTLAQTDVRTTARDTAHYLAGLQGSQWFSKEARDFILSSLSEQKYRQGIPAGCPTCTVLDKSGQLGGYAHDAGIVTDGKSQYVIVVLSRGGSSKQVAQVSKLAHDRLGDQSATAAAH